MRSLLHQTTLAITTVLVLISCATQTQAAGTAVTGNQAKEYYARNFIERVAAKEGISNLEWIAVESNAVSFAKIMHGRERGFMKCTTLYKRHL
ncbi:hypothetical protein BDF22DRAFT_693010 [Syncephalis plumigaleata]|nr:hypothetical protein BDF22DRAFT_693010 [Syncephalis plumigaleata]